MDRKSLRAFNAEAMAALEKIADEHGMNIRAGTHRFTEANATLKFELMDVSPSGEVKSPEAEAWKLNAHRYGFQAEDLGGTFVSRGETYKITGLKTRRPKYPVSATKLSNGRPHKFPVEMVKNIVQAGTGRRAAIRAQKGLTDEIKKEFVSLACQLSPENISWDGERKPSEVNKARAAINRRWRELEAQAGRKVTESDAFGFDTN